MLPSACQPCSSIFGNNISLFPVFFHVNATKLALFIWRYENVKYGGKITRGIDSFIFSRLFLHLAMSAESFLDLYNAQIYSSALLLVSCKLTEHLYKLFTLLHDGPVTFFSLTEVFFSLLPSYLCTLDRSTSFFYYYYSLCILHLGLQLKRERAKIIISVSPDGFWIITLEEVH